MQLVRQPGDAHRRMVEHRRGDAWLANKLHAHGDTLQKGDIILAGSFTKPMWVEPGDTVHADYGKLGAITCRFQ